MDHPTKLEYFTAAAITGILANHRVAWRNNKLVVPQHINGQDSYLSKDDIVKEAIKIAKEIMLNLEG